MTDTIESRGSDFREGVPPFVAQQQKHKKRFDPKDFQRQFEDSPEEIIVERLRQDPSYILSPEFSQFVHDNPQIVGHADFVKLVGDDTFIAKVLSKEWMQDMQQAGELHLAQLQLNIEYIKSPKFLQFVKQYPEFILMPEFQNILTKNPEYQQVLQQLLSQAEGSSIATKAILHAHALTWIGGVVGLAFTDPVSAVGVAVQPLSEALQQLISQAEEFSINSKSMGYILAAAGVVGLAFVDPVLAAGAVVSFGAAAKGYKKSAVVLILLLLAAKAAQEVDAVNTTLKEALETILLRDAELESCECDPVNEGGNSECYDQSWDDIIEKYNLDRQQVRKTCISQIGDSSGGVMNVTVSDECMESGTEYTCNPFTEVTPPPSSMPLNTPVPSPVPSAMPAPVPTPSPSPAPMPSPSPAPSAMPSPAPTSSPSPAPMPSPSPAPMPSPFPAPMSSPSPAPMPSPSPAPMPSPSPAPTSEGGSGFFMDHWQHIAAVGGSLFAAAVAASGGVWAYKSGKCFNKGYQPSTTTIVTSEFGGRVDSLLAEGDGEGSDNNGKDGNKEKFGQVVPHDYDDDGFLDINSEMEEDENSRYCDFFSCCRRKPEPQRFIGKVTFEEEDEEEDKKEEEEEEQQGVVDVDVDVLEKEGRQEDLIAGLSGPG